MEHWYDDSAHDDHKAGLARVVSQERPRPPLDSGTCAIAKVEAGSSSITKRRRRRVAAAKSWSLANVSFINGKQLRI